MSGMQFSSSSSETSWVDHLSKKIPNDNRPLNKNKTLIENSSSSSFCFSVCLETFFSTKRIETRADECSLRGQRNLTPPVNFFSTKIPSLNISLTLRLFRIGKPLNLSVSCLIGVKIFYKGNVAVVVVALVIRHGT